jgi:hypothetical protein
MLASKSHQEKIIYCANKINTISFKKYTLSRQKNTLYSIFINNLPFRYNCINHKLKIIKSRQTSSCHFTEVGKHASFGACAREE